MKIIIKELGVLRDSEFTLAPLTIVCGKNNTGKSYLANVVTEICQYQTGSSETIANTKCFDELLSTGKQKLHIEMARLLCIEEANNITKRCINSLHKRHQQYRSLGNYQFNISIDADMSIITIDKTWRSEKGNELHAYTKPGMDYIDLTLVNAVDRSIDDNEYHWVMTTIDDVVSMCCIDTPICYVASSERMAISVYGTELEERRNQTIPEPQNADGSVSVPIKVFHDYYQFNTIWNESYYRLFAYMSQFSSQLCHEHPEILNVLSMIAGGTYLINDEGAPIFRVRDGSVDIPINSASSSVQSLFSIWIYLIHKVMIGSMIVIDEPEMNLHISNQRKMARLIALLVNAGVKVYITTHSDTIMRELNALIMLYHRLPESAEYAKSMGYDEHELLDKDKVAVYMAKRINEDEVWCHLQRAEITAEMGIDADTFDNELNEMMEIQRDIMFGMPWDKVDNNEPG